MNTASFISVSLLAGAAAAQAEVPVFHDAELRLDAVAMLSEDGARYYRNLVLERDADGTFDVESAERRPLVTVHDVDVNQYAVGGEKAVSAVITGITSVACVVLEEPALERIGPTFHVVLAETVMEPGSVCASLLPNTPFELSLPLDTAGLPTGTYTVNVNGTTESFLLQSP